MSAPSMWMLAKVGESYEDGAWKETFESHLELAQPEADQFLQDPKGFFTKLLTDAGFQVNRMEVTISVKNLIPMQVITSKAQCELRLNIVTKKSHTKSGKQQSTWTTETQVWFKCMEQLPLVPLVPNMAPRG